MVNGKLLVYIFCHVTVCCGRLNANLVLVDKMKLIILFCWMESIYSVGVK